jgi:hypothetical protein
MALHARTHVVTLAARIASHRIAIASPPAVLMSASTPTPNSDPASNFSVIFETALDEYKNRTGQDLQSHPFAISLDLIISNNNNNTPDAILEVFRRQAQAFDKFRRRDDKLMACLTSIVNILCMLSAVDGLVSPPLLHIAILQRLFRSRSLLQRQYLLASVFFSG